MTEPYRSQYPYPPTQPPKKKKRSPSFWVLMALIAVVVIVPIVAFLGCSAVVGGVMIASSSTTPVEDPYTEAVTEEGNATSEPSTKKAEKSAADATIGEGTHEVGVDIKPGRYKVTVPDDSFNCYWARTKNDSGELDDIIANENHDAGARASVTIKKGEFFETSGCGTWTKVS